MIYWKKDIINFMADYGVHIKIILIIKKVNVI